MGTEPMAAARCVASWPRLSLTRADALCAISLRAVSRLFLEAVKCRAVWPLLSAGATSVLAVYKCSRTAVGNRD